MADWTDPETWVAEEVPPASKFNANIRDNLLVLSQLAQPINDEVLGAGTRSSGEWGPLADAAGPEVEFLTGPSGAVLYMITAQVNVQGGDGGNAWISLEIRDSGSDVVVAPAEWRAIRRRIGWTESKVFMWVEHLTAGETYTAEVVYKSDQTIEARDRRLLVYGVREVPA